MDTPKGTKEDARFALVTDARTFFLICDTPESARFWCTRLESEWTRVQRHLGDADSTTDLLSTAEIALIGNYV